MGICELAKGQRGGSGQQAWVTGMRRGNSHSTAVDCVGDCWQGEPFCAHILCLGPAPPLPSHALSGGAQATPGAVRCALTSTQEWGPRPTVTSTQEWGPRSTLTSTQELGSQQLAVNVSGDGKGN